jgi:hypothetical protein
MSTHKNNQWDLKCKNKYTMECSDTIVRGEMYTAV